MKTLRTYTGVAIIVIWGLGPFYWMGVTAFRDLQFTFDTTPWPTHVTWDNFETVFSTARGNHFGRALVNSVIISGLTTLVSMVVGVFAAYALARLQFRGKFIVLGFVLAASMFPGVALITPLFELFRNIGWFGTYQALVIPDISFALPLTIYVLTAFLRDMPWELEEAAKIDGATPGKAFRLIILPLAAPGIFTAAILAFITAWNEYTHRQPAEQRRDPAGHGGDRELRRRPAPRRALHRGHGGRLRGDGPAHHHGAGVPATDRGRSDRRRGEGLMRPPPPSQGSLFSAIVTTVGSHEPAARLQKTEVALGMVAFFAFFAVVRTAASTLQGAPSAPEALVAALCVGLGYLLLRRRQALLHKMSTPSIPHNGSSGTFLPVKESKSQWQP